MESRQNQALNVRIAAAELAFNRPQADHVANGEELKYQFAEESGDRKNKPSHIANYTKGLPHNADGLLTNPDDFQQFVKGIDSGDPQDFRDTPLGPPSDQQPKHYGPWESKFTKAAAEGPDPVAVRAWESAGAGLTFDLEGPDAQAVTMPPAPTFDSAELTAEMAEVYAMALLRDVPFSEFNDSLKVKKAIELLNKLDWFKDSELDLSKEATARRRGELNPQNIFRGNTFGDCVGPYLSQFLMIGSPELGDGDRGSVLDGRVMYGALNFTHRVRTATPKKDYMTTWEWYLDVQNGADLRGTETYVGKGRKGYQFINTPRDLATYVHYDALYEAYLNACLTMLAMGVPFDPGIPFQGADVRDHQQGFAQFGGPHILSLVTEVATRALKAVRFQKFNVHRRLRPEALAGRIHQWKTTHNANFKPIATMSDTLHHLGLLDLVNQHNQYQNKEFMDGRQHDSSAADILYLLPMAFPEGSPMHPAYGAGHATVAGACVTILKAFFHHGYVLPKPYAIVTEAEKNGEKTSLSAVQDNTLELTVEGELNKLASNISIGRNWAGVHYFTDYHESIRLGEAIAIGILEEQKLTYGENFSMTVPLYDGGTVRI